MAHNVQRDRYVVRCAQLTSPFETLTPRRTGLATARGSGTNGYVQRNLSALRPRDKQPHQSPHYTDDLPAPSLLRKPNQEILLHERKRQVEVQCLELRENLESQNNLKEEEIEERVDTLRAKLLRNLQKMTQDEKTLKEHQVHQLAEAKEKKNADMQRAFGIGKDFIEGAAFDKELQVNSHIFQIMFFPHGIIN